MLADPISKTVHRGDLRADLDPALAVAMLTGSVIVRDAGSPGGHHRLLG